MTWPCSTIGETSDHAPYVECVWASGLNVARAASGCAYPGTPEEREALREAGGGSDTAGASFAQLAQGWLARYHHTADTSHALSGSWSYITSELASGHFIAVAGWYANLPLKYRRWQAGSAFNHAIALGPDPVGAWMVDPLGPDGYGGEAIPLADLFSFCSGDAFKALSGAGWKGGGVAIPAVLTITPKAGTITIPPLIGGVVNQVNGYDPFTPNQVVKTGHWGSTQTARVDAEVSVGWNDQSTPRGTFLRVASDYFKGLLVPPSRVTFTPDAVVPPGGGHSDQELKDAQKSAAASVSLAATNAAAQY